MMNSTEAGMHDEEGVVAKQMVRIGVFVCFTLALLIYVSLSQLLRGMGLVSKDFNFIGWAGSAVIALLVSYIFGLIHDVNLKNELLPLWAVLLVFMYATISGDYLKPNDRSNMGMLIVKFIIYIVYAVIMFIGTQPSSYIPLSLLLLGSCFKVAENVSVHFFLSYANQLIRPDVKADDDAIEDDNETDPFLRCKYAVYPGSPKFEVEDPSELITIKEIFGIEKEEIWRLEIQNQCLSVALFWKLLRRIVGIPTYESSHQSKAWKLIQNGLLQPETEERCPFSVLEDELSVLYNFLHHSTGFFLYQFGLRCLIISKLTSLAPMVGIVIMLSRKLKLEHDIGSSSIHKQVGTYHSYTWATLVIFSYITLVHFMQLYACRLSTWPQLSTLCSNLQSESRKNRRYGLLVSDRPKLIRKPLKSFEILAEFYGTRLLTTKLAQYSVLESFSSKQHFCWKICSSVVHTLSGIQMARFGKKQGKDAFLTKELKKAIRHSLLDYGPHVSNGIASLEDIELPAEVQRKLIQACNHFKMDVEVVLVWHIATSICEIRHKPSSESTCESDEFKVATTLSKYCAYLVVSAPDLLPGDTDITDYTCRLAIEDVYAHLKDCESLDNKYGKLMQIAEEVNFENIETGGRDKNTILQQAAFLGKVLEEEITEPSKRWEILAKFWAEMILYLAPNENNEWAHVEKLASQREFITILWVLLFHAGIVNRDSLRNKPRETMN